MEVEFGDSLAKLIEHAVADDHIARELDPRRFVEHTRVIGGPA